MMNCHSDSLKSIKKILSDLNNLMDKLDDLGELGSDEADELADNLYEQLGDTVYWTLRLIKLLRGNENEMATLD